MGLQDTVVVLEEQGAVATLWLNRPDALNALNQPLRRAFVEAIQEVDRRPDLRVVILRAKGRAFCVGQDLAELRAHYQAHGPQLGQLVRDEYIPLVTALRQLSKPTVAVLQGPAVGGGVALALATDFRVISHRAALGLAFVNVGLAPDSGVTWWLARTLGLLPAIAHTMLGHTLSAADLVARGLAARVNESDAALDAELDELVQRLSQGPTLAYAQIRQLFDAVQTLSWDQALALEATVQDRLAQSHDHQDALSAFLAKRPPQFEGR